MNGYEFMSQHPWLTGFVAVIIGITVISTVEAITKIWRKPDDKRIKKKKAKQALLQ